MSQTPTPEALAAAKRHLFTPHNSILRSLALAFDAHTIDLQNTIIRLTRELGEARDAEAAKVADWLREQRDAKRLARDQATNPEVREYLDHSAIVTSVLATAISHHEHRKELSHDT